MTPAGSLSALPRAMQQSQQTHPNLSTSMQQSSGAAAAQYIGCSSEPSTPITAQPVGSTATEINNTKRGKISSPTSQSSDALGKALASVSSQGSILAAVM